MPEFEFGTFDQFRGFFENQTTGKRTQFVSSLYAIITQLSGRGWQIVFVERRIDNPSYFLLWFQREVTEGGRDVE